MTAKRRFVLSQIIAGLVLTATLITLGLTWWLSDAVLARSRADWISRDAAEMLSIVGTAIQYYLLPAIAVLVVLSVGNLILCLKSRREIVKTPS